MKQLLHMQMLRKRCFFFILPDRKYSRCWGRERFDYTPPWYFVPSSRHG